MRRIRYQVACSLDGYIADPAGTTGWIVDEPAIDFGALFDQFDTLLMGRVTYEGMAKQAEGFWGKKVLVFSKSLRQEEHPQVTVVSSDTRDAVNQLRSQPGKDIWLFGGGKLFQSLLQPSSAYKIEDFVLNMLLFQNIEL